MPPTLRVSLFVAPGGQAPSVGMGADKPIDPKWAACAAQVVSRWKFEDPRGKVAHVTYQF